MKKLHVLVTGAGALLGQGILRCLRMLDRPLHIVTADPDCRAPGHWIGDAAYLVPMAGAADYLERIEEIIAREAIDLLFVGTDVELPVLSRERRRLEGLNGTKVVVASPEVVEIAEDKWLTVGFLQQYGFPYARSALSSQPGAVSALVETVGLPLISKPRCGARSVGLQLIDDLAMLAALCKTRPDLIIQERISDADGEFTAGCLVTDGRCRSVVVLKRDLRDGNTIRAYSDPDYQRFAPFLGRVAETLGVDGPCNFQFRIRDRQPVIFEINARFSGTTPIRAIFGHNEVAALVNLYADGIVPPPATLRNGAVFKTWSDIYVDSRQVEMLRGAGVLTRPDGCPHHFIGEKSPGP